MLAVVALTFRLRRGAKEKRGGQRRRTTDIIRYRFIRPKLLVEATLATGTSISYQDIDGNVEGNKPLTLIGDALIRLDIAIRSYARGTGTGKYEYARESMD